MKKIVALILALSMMFVLCACGAKEETNNRDETAKTSHQGDAEIYSEAEALFEQGEIYNAAIKFASIADYSDARERSLSIWHQAKRYQYNTFDFVHNVRYTKSIGGKKTGWKYFREAIGISNYGMLYIQHESHSVTDFPFPNVNDIEQWERLISIHIGNNSKELYAVGLRDDGKVYCSLPDVDLSNWNDVVSIEGTGSEIVGLRANGTLLIAAAGTSNNPYSEIDWENVISVYYSCTDFGSKTETDGKREKYLIGVKSDGTLVGTGSNNNGQLNLRGRGGDYISIQPFDGYMICLKKDGSVDSYEYMPKHDSTNNLDSLRTWEDIVQIVPVDEPDYRRYAVIGLTSEGNVVYSLYGDDDDYYTRDKIKDIESKLDALAGSTIEKLFILDGAIYGLTDGGYFLFSKTGDETEAFERWRDIRCPSALAESSNVIVGDLSSTDIATWLSGLQYSVSSITSKYSKIQTNDTGDALVFTLNSDTITINGTVSKTDQYKSLDIQFGIDEYGQDFFNHGEFSGIASEVTGQNTEPKGRAYIANLWRAGRIVSDLAGIDYPANGNIDVLLDARDNPQQVGDWVYTMELNKDGTAIIIHATKKQ